MVGEREPRKIAFVGTSSVGKTELINQLKLRHSDDPRIAFVPEAARMFFTSHPEIPQDVRFSTVVQGQVQDLQLRLERVAHNSNAVDIFCDRSVLDAIVYSRAYGDLEGSEELFIKVASWLATYYRIMLLDPKDVQYQKDDVRQEDEQTRQKNHDEFVTFFEEKQIPYEVLAGTVEERLDRVEQILQE